MNDVPFRMMRPEAEALAKAEDEIKRLRAALEEIASSRWWGNDGVSVETREATIARRALEQTEPA